MESLHPPTVIAFGALIFVLAVVFYALLYPVREKQEHFEKRLDSFDNELKDLKAGQAKLSSDIAEIKQLLSKN